jgi:SAM-dependent methyltransferase
MADQEARYDRIAEGYARWWSPIHRPATLAMLDVIAPEVEAGATRILDLGCGTGAFAAAAVSRWPAAKVTGIDVSAGMLEVADRELADLPPSARERVDLVQAAADQVPFEDGAFDVVVSSFVLQLVPSAHRVLREGRRTLKRGSMLVFATWLAGGSLAADEAYADALVAAGLEPPGGGGGHDDDPRSPRNAAARLRRAGFAGVTATQTEIVHHYTPETYLAFVANFDDEDLFANLDPVARAGLESDLLDRLRALPEDGLRLRLPVVIASGRRSGRA